MAKPQIIFFLKKQRCNKNVAYCNEIFHRSIRLQFSSIFVAKKHS